MSINCEILDLRAFLSVVELENFHRSAEALNLSQLFHISRRDSEAGAGNRGALARAHHASCLDNRLGTAELIPLVRRMLEEFDTSLFAVRDVGSPSAAAFALTIACLPTAAFYFLPTVIKQFSAEYPNIRFFAFSICRHTDDLAGSRPRGSGVRHQYHGFFRSRPHLREAHRRSIRAGGTQGSSRWQRRANSNGTIWRPIN